MKSHNEFLKEVKEVTREPTLPERTHNAFQEKSE